MKKRGHLIATLITLVLFVMIGSKPVTVKAATSTSFKSILCDLPEEARTKVGSRYFFTRISSTSTRTKYDIRYASTATGNGYSLATFTIPKPYGQHTYWDQRFTTNGDTLYYMTTENTLTKVDVATKTKSTVKALNTRLKKIMDTDSVHAYPLLAYNNSILITCAREYPNTSATFKYDMSTDELDLVSYTDGSSSTSRYVFFRLYDYLSRYDMKTGKISHVASVIGKAPTINSKLYLCTRKSSYDSAADATTEIYTLREYDSATLEYRTVKSFKTTYTRSSTTSTTYYFGFIYGGYAYYQKVVSSNRYDRSDEITYYKVRLTDGSTTTVSRSTYEKNFNKSTALF